MDEFKVAPPNALLFVSDPYRSRLPITNQPVTVGRGVVAVGTVAPFDGPTTVRALGADDSRPEGMFLAFDGTIETPSRLLTISNVHHDIHFTFDLGSRAADVRIWTNDVSEPDLIVIGAKARHETTMRSLIRRLASILTR